jgi:hypothetical protein
MEADSRRLDGNVMAGLLEEIFPFEMTMVRVTCGACGTEEPAGAHLVYLDAPGAVMRCCHCNHVLMRVVKGRRRYWVEMQGVRCMEIVVSH